MGNTRCTHQGKLVCAEFRTRAHPPQDTALAQAAYRTLTTLAFLCPSIYINVTIERVRSDLDSSSLDFIGLEERGIWATPPDQVFVDGKS